MADFLHEDPNDAYGYEPYEYEVYEPCEVDEDSEILAVSLHARLPKDHPLVRWWWTLELQRSF